MQLRAPVDIDGQAGIDGELWAGPIPDPQSPLFVFAQGRQAHCPTF
jgi:hypothetical protein